MSRKIRNLRAAREEFAAAVRWFEEQRAGLGAEFYDEVIATTARLEALPESGSPMSRDLSTRRLLLPRFPYQVVYRLTPTEIVLCSRLPTSNADPPTGRIGSKTVELADPGRPRSTGRSAMTF